MNYTGIFTYNSAYLVTEPQQWAISLIFIGIFFVALVFFRKLFLYFVGYYWTLRDRKKVAERSKILNDLQMMRELQTELEKEIEQATLKAAFQN